MAGSTLTQNITKLDVPRSLARKSNGFAIDIGGSVLKLVYLLKEEWEGGNQNATSGTVSLCLTSCGKDGIKDAIDFVKKHVYIKRSESGEPTVIYTTGAGLGESAEQFTKELNIKMQSIVEFDGFTQGADFLLKTYPASEVFTFQPEAFREGIEHVMSTSKALEPWVEMAQHTRFLIDKEKGAGLKAYIESKQRAFEQGKFSDSSEPHRYPYILGMFGSGMAYLKVYADLTCKMVDMTAFAGRSFLDLGCLLTGSKSYEELIALAEKGNEDKLNVRMCDLMGAVEGDVYSTGRQNRTVVYNFGKAHDKQLDEVSKADLARTLLHTICVGVLKTGAHVMVQENCRDLYLAGSFAASPLMQHILTKQFEAQRVDLVGLGNEDLSVADLRMRIIRVGGVLGALGAFLEGCQ